MLVRQTVCLAVLIIFFSITGAYAQQTFLHESGWTVGSTFPNPALQPGQIPQPIQPAPQVQDPSVTAAWNQVWGPISDITGVSVNTAQNYMEASKTRFKGDSDLMLDNARAWAVIVGNLGIGKLAKDVAKDWFMFTATDVPSKLAGN